jgi:hypothetical protein
MNSPHQDSRRTQSVRHSPATDWMAPSPQTRKNHVHTPTTPHPLSSGTARLQPRPPLSAFAFQFKSLFRVFSVFRGQKSCATRPNQNRREPDTNRTTLPIQQSTAAQKRTKTGSKANRTRTKSRIFPASVSIHALDLHQFQKMPESTEPPATFPAQPIAITSHRFASKILRPSPPDSLQRPQSPVRIPNPQSAIPNPKFFRGVPSCCGGARCLLIPRMLRSRPPHAQPPECLE